MIMDESCARCWNRKWPKGLPWDGRRQGEESDSVRARHAYARQECMRCPLLDACEAYLSDQETDGTRVDGITAGRYSDVNPHEPSDVAFQQTTCRGCQESMRPQRTPAKPPRLTPRKKHRGEGLCQDCWPNLSRQANPKERYSAPPRPNHPYKTA